MRDKEWTAAINAQGQGSRIPGMGSLGIEGQRPGVEVTHLELLIPASILNLGDRVTEGQLIEAVALPWFEILKELERDPQFLHQLCWRRVEELVAGAYKREGWPEVILTPRSGDGGRDIIAIKPGVGAVRIIDQVKAYSPGQKATAAEVRELYGVLTRDQNVSKGIVTTTATFAPHWPIPLILAHCEAGISRSAGVVAAINDWMPEKLIVTQTGVPNRLVWRLVREALTRKTLGASP